MNGNNPGRPAIALVAAMGARNEIGMDGTMPWHLPADLRHFKDTTMGHTLLMGRRTFESIGRALPGRDSFIVTRNTQFVAPGCRVFSSITAAVAAAPAERTLMVTGGATIYEALLPHAQWIYLTRIDATFAADTWFPELDAAVWRPVASEVHEPDAKNRYGYRFVTLARRC